MKEKRRKKKERDAKRKKLLNLEKTIKKIKKLGKDPEYDARIARINKEMEHVRLKK